MNLQQMNYVLAIANTGSFREAARKLFISQPSLSTSIKELEAEIGVSLFIRTNRGAQLTEEGLTFVAHAEKVLTQMELLETRYKSPQQTERFSISSQHYDFLSGILANVMQRFGAQYTEYRLFETTTLKVIEDVNSFHSELGLLYLNAQNRTGIERYLEKTNLTYQVIGEFQTHIFLGKQHPLARQKEIQPAQLSCYPQVRFAQEGSNFAYFSEDLVETPEQEQVIYTSDRGTLMNLLAQTNAYASGSGKITGLVKNDIRLIPLADQPANKLCVLHQKQRPLSAAAALFIEELTALFAQ